MIMKRERRRIMRSQELQLKFVVQTDMSNNPTAINDQINSQQACSRSILLEDRCMC